MTIKFFSPKESHYELSNFYPLEKPISINLYDFCYTCNTSEHLYQALKYNYSGAPDINLEMVKLITSMNTPYKSKIADNSNSHQNIRYAWQKDIVDKAQVIIDKGVLVNPEIDKDEVRIEMMRYTLHEKFTNDEHCKSVLLSTGDEKLLEWSPYDAFWGGKKEGSKNYLGILLEELRNEMRNEMK
jgi:predicted NAD-dependent protein-ADP-ribosyltransferase YbiA (DUF1768 family)